MTTPAEKIIATAIASRLALCFARGGPVPAMSVGKLTEIVADAMESCRETVADAEGPIPSSAVVLPREVVEQARGLLDKAAVEIASTGAPFTHGKYDKNGEWSFAAMTENGNPADAAAIKAGFLLLQEAAALLPPTGAGVGE